MNSYSPRQLYDDDFFHLLTKKLKPYNYFLSEDSDCIFVCRYGRPLRNGDMDIDVCFQIPFGNFDKTGVLNTIEAEEQELLEGDIYILKIKYQNHFCINPTIDEINQEFFKVKDALVGALCRKEKIKKYLDNESDS